MVVQRLTPTQHVWRNAQDRGLAWAHGPVRDGNSALALSRKMGGSWRGHCGCTGVAFIPRQLRQEGSTHQPAPERLPQEGLNRVCQNKLSQPQLGLAV